MLNEVKLIGVYQNDISETTKEKSLLSIVVYDDLSDMATAKLSVQIPTPVAIELEKNLTDNAKLLVEGSLLTKRLNFKEVLNLSQDYYVNVQIINASRITILESVAEYRIDTFKGESNYS